MHDDATAQYGALRQTVSLHATPKKAELILTRRDWSSA